MSGDSLQTFVVQPMRDHRFVTSRVEKLYRFVVFRRRHYLFAASRPPLVAEGHESKSKVTVHSTSTKVTGHCASSRSLRGQGHDETARRRPVCSSVALSNVEHAPRTGAEVSWNGEYVWRRTLPLLATGDLCLSAVQFIRSS